MKKIGIFLTALLLSTGAMAKPVKNFDQAVDLVMKSVEKNKLTSLKQSCLSFMPSDETEVYYYVDVRERHNEECGGDPETSPRIMSYQVHKKNGKLCTDSIEWAERLKADDPYDFECRLIK